jgi:hypothetical protein
MKKRFFLLYFLIVGCATPATPQEIIKTPQAIIKTPQETLRNEQCLDSNKLKTLQVLDHGVLAHLCPSYPSYYHRAFDACRVEGDLVYMPVKQQDNDYVDDEIVQLSSDKCFTADGVYKYTTRENIRKTVRKLKIINLQVEN